MQNPNPTPTPGTHRVRPRGQCGPDALGVQRGGALDRTLGPVRHAAPDRAAPARPPRRPGVSPVVFAVDAHGNVLGGIRTPLRRRADRDAGGLRATARAPGAPPSSAFCSLFGRTVPFTDGRARGAVPEPRAASCSRISSPVWRRFTRVTCSCRMRSPCSEPPCCPTSASSGPAAGLTPSPWRSPSRGRLAGAGVAAAIRRFRPA